jgi:hypothetical protein
MMGRSIPYFLTLWQEEKRDECNPFTAPVPVANPPGGGYR